MTRDDLIKLAGKHAICTSDDHKEFLHDGLLAFAADLLAAERAACAKLCMDKAYKMEREAVDAEKEGDDNTRDDSRSTAWVLAVCSQEILARKDEPLANEPATGSTAATGRRSGPTTPAPSTGKPSAPAARHRTNTARQSE